MKITNNKTVLADDRYESIGTLFKLRIPSLGVGLVLGIALTFLTSSFEEVIARDVHVAFFLPFVIYIADAVANQTESIYARDLKNGRDGFSTYFWKELSLGIIFGIIFSLISGGVAWLWLGDHLVAQTVALSSFLAIAIAPLVALIVAHTLQAYHRDPAAGTGPIATVIQDVISVIIYGFVASLIIL